MCDIIVATPDATATGATIFGKNSDRDPNEAQALAVHDPRPGGDDVQATHVRVDAATLPDREETNRVLLSRPWWTWGAEMGANEQGLVGGNVAVFTREPYRERGLLGMDILRLALEYTETPEVAVDVVGNLLETVGQGGNNSYSRSFEYHNSFIFADRDSAWLLESAGEIWVAREIEGVTTISNRLTIGNDWDRSSSVDPVERAIDCGWHDPKDPFDFATSYTDPGLVTRLSGAVGRRSCTAEGCTQPMAIDRDTVMDLLATHDHEPYVPAHGSTRDVCMHYGGTTRPSQAAASQVSVLSADGDTHWLTVGSHPCLSAYKPVTLEGGLPDLGEPPTNTYDPDSYWWRLEALHRRLEAAPLETRMRYRGDRDTLQERIDALEGTPAERTAAAFALERDLHATWDDRVEAASTSLVWHRRRAAVDRRASLPPATRPSVLETLRSAGIRLRRVLA